MENPQSAAMDSIKDRQSHPLELPAELCNRVYDFAFVNDFGEMNLLDYEFPSTALLRTFWQLYKEATGIFKSAGINSMNTSRFVIDFESNGLYMRTWRKWTRPDNTMLLHMPFIEDVVPNHKISPCLWSNHS